MKHSEKEIVDALKVIQSVCQHNICDDNGCPFYNGDCGIKYETPCEWDIVDVNLTFKAFK